MVHLGSMFPLSKPCGQLIELHRWDLWQPGLGVVDITNPAAREWYSTKLDALIDLGVDTFKVGLTAFLQSNQV